jgi:hypothetical protein
LLPFIGHIVFTTVAGQGWLAGPKPSLDAPQHVASASYAIKPLSAWFFPGFDGLVDHVCY